VLTAKNYDVTLREYPAAHDMFAWREILAQGLGALIGN
jgi:enterochelin esterase-like enzyme